MNDKLKQALKGTYFDNKKRYGLLFWVALSIIAAFFIWIVPSPESAEPQTTRNSAPVLPKVSRDVYFTVPANGEPITVYRGNLGNCNSDNLGKNPFISADTDRTEGPTFTSTGKKPITGRVRFYEQMRGKTCLQTAAYLRDRGLLK